MVRKRKKKKIQYKKIKITQFIERKKVINEQKFKISLL